MCSIVQRTVLTVLILTCSAAGPVFAGDIDAPADPADHRLDQLETLVRQQQQQLQQQQQQLRQQSAELAEMRREEDSQWLNERRRAEIKALVGEVLEDAEQRASLLEGGLYAGWDNGFFLASADGNNKLILKGLLQTRYTINIQDETGDPSTDDTSGGFGITRSRFGFAGHVIDPTWQFLLWTGFDCEGDAVVLDAYVKKDLGNGFALTMGQFKIPYLYEYLVSETRLQFIERSLVAGEFCGTYTQGIMLSYSSEQFRAYASFNDGLSTLNTRWDADGTDYAGTGRVEVKLAGDWKQYSDWESFRDEDFMAVIAGAIHYQEGEHGTITDELEILRWTVDGSVEFGGANLFAALVGNHTENGGDIDQIAVVLQGGYFLTDNWEAIARYEWAHTDVSGQDDLSVVSAGIVYFFAKQRLKWQADIGYSFNGIGSVWVSDPLGYRLDAGNSDGQIVIRTQLHLLF